MHPKTSPRAQYRQQENQRSKDSASLADKFQELKTLTVDLEHFDPARLIKTSQIKYTVNLAYERSLFRFNCSNEECVGGDFDLSSILAQAVANRQVSAVGEVACHGWRGKNMVNEVTCGSILRYRLSLGY